MFNKLWRSAAFSNMERQGFCFAFLCARYYLLKFPMSIGRLSVISYISFLIELNRLKMRIICLFFLICFLNSCGTVENKSIEDFNPLSIDSKSIEGFNPLSEDGVVLLAFDQPTNKVEWLYKTVSGEHDSEPKTFYTINGSFYPKEVRKTIYGKEITRDFDNKLILPLRLPVGRYKIINFSYDAGYWKMKSKRDMSIIFNVYPGKVTYFGRLRLSHAGSPSGPYFDFNILDQSKEDIAKFLYENTHIPSYIIKKDSPIY